MPNTTLDPARYPVGGVYSDHPAATGLPVTQGHTNYCEINGHATWVVDGIDLGRCARCDVAVLEAEIAVVGDLVAFPNSRNTFVVESIDADGIAECVCGGLTRSGPVASLRVIAHVDARTDGEIAAAVADEVDLSTRDRAAAWDKIADHPVFAGDYGRDLDSTFVEVVYAHLDLLHALERIASGAVRPAEPTEAEIAAHEDEVDAEIAAHEERIAAEDDDRA